MEIMIFYFIEAFFLSLSLSLYKYQYFLHSSQPSHYVNWQISDPCWEYNVYDSLRHM